MLDKDNVNIEVRKADLLDTLTEIEREANILLRNIAKFREDIALVSTVEEAKEFDETHNLEEGLNLINVWGK